MYSFSRTGVKSAFLEQHALPTKIGSCQEESTLAGEGKSGVWRIDRKARKKNTTVEEGKSELKKSLNYKGLQI